MRYRQKSGWWRVIHFVYLPGAKVGLLLQEESLREQHLPEALGGVLLGCWGASWGQRARLTLSQAGLCRGAERQMCCGSPCWSCSAATVGALAPGGEAPLPSHGGGGRPN